MPGNTPDKNACVASTLRIRPPFTGHFLGRGLRESGARGTMRIALDALHPSGCPGHRPAYGHDADVINRPVSIGAGSWDCSWLGHRGVVEACHSALLGGRLHAEFVGLFLRNDSDELGNLHDDVFHGLFGRTESTTRRECRSDLVKLLERHPVHDRH